MEEKEIENAKREKLRREKPLVFEKVVRIAERHQRGVATPIIDIAYSYACNLKCQHCTAARFAKKSRILVPADLRKLSDEAHALGLCQFCISGGEPLLFKDLDEVIRALQPDKFHLAMSTNGHFMTKDMARHLKGLGLDKVKISLDDYDEQRHNENRRCEGAYQKAIDAMLNAKEAGLSVVIQTVVTHQNCRSDRLFGMARFAQEHGFTVDILIARATGAWEGKHEVLIDEEDAEFLRKAHEQYPVLHRDTFPAYGMDKGCGCVDSTLHVTQYGDVTPCVYIPISLGSLFEESLADIIKRGQRIKCFKKYSPLCLSGEDRTFINTYMAQSYGKPLPIPWTAVFSEDDLD
ncbi:MAG: radical SAM protein [Candidatus Riflebacteria bacterium]|nr:radical SAM protein [Candidatus Riflebacteria bacterium]